MYSLYMLVMICIITIRYSYSIVVISVLCVCYSFYSDSVCDGDSIHYRTKQIGLFDLLSYYETDICCPIIVVIIVFSIAESIHLSWKRYLVPASALFYVTLSVCSYYLEYISVAISFLYEYRVTALISMRHQPIQR